MSNEDRELDLRIARVIFSKTRICTHKKYTDECGAFCTESCEGFIVPNYSTEISAAMAVIGKMRESGFVVLMRNVK